jgi:hypothetical protein
MVRKSEVRLERSSVALYRRAILKHLMRQSGGPTPDPRDAIRLSTEYYGLMPREARLGRFTARICRLGSDEWSLDFNPQVPKIDLVTAIWHELSELLCLTGDILDFEAFNSSNYRESATSAYDLRHLCAVGVERFVGRKLLDYPSVRCEHNANQIRRILIARGSTAPAEPILPLIEREPWYDDEYDG